MKPHAKVLFLHTGGTLGMAVERPLGPLLPSTYAEDVLPYVRGLEEIADIEGQMLANLDSSDLLPSHWEAMGREIAKHRDAFDGFVILHGTDTMAYTAAALSYMLRGLDRPVVLTGSQRPLRDVRTDARLNLIHATLTATMGIPEVAICFSSRVYRGNRARKESIQELDAFRSPNFPPLLEFGVEIIAGAPPLQAPTVPFALTPGFSNAVAVLSLFPGARPGMLDRVVDDGAKAVVVVGFGDGNVPTAGWPEAIGRASAKGALVVVASQAPKGSVKAGRYVGSEAARAAGASFAGDMTLEAVVVKLMWILARATDRADAVRMFDTILAGERS